MTLNNQNGKVKTKEELKQELQSYQTILSKSMMEYLEQLIELEFSVVRKNISDEERLILSKLEIYKDTEIYNIYHKAIQLLEQSEIELSIYPMEDNLGASIKIEDRCIQLFSFDVKKTYLKEIMEDGRYSQIRTISLYQSLADEESIRRVIEGLEDTIKIYKKAKMPFWFGVESKTRRDQWDIITGGKIWRNRNMIRELSSLNEANKKASKYSKAIHDLFMQDYGLTEADFKEVEDAQEERENMQKVYVKNMPTLQIERKVNLLDYL